MHNIWNLYEAAKKVNNLPIKLFFESIKLSEFNDSVKRFDAPGDSLFFYYFRKHPFNHAA